MVKIVLAQPRGFCAGVIRAIDIVDQALERVGAPVYVRHEIVHNKHVVDKLRDKGAVFVEDLSEIPEGAVTVFSAHGVARSVYDAAEARGLPILDATCPLVSKVHNQGRRYVKSGRTVIMIGHEGHPEVVGTIGQIDAPVQLVGTVEDVMALTIPVDEPVAYITQTTLSVDDTRSVIAALRERYHDVEGPDVSEICYATQNRQSAVRDLCKVADLLLVVGSSSSSNSNRLRDVGVESSIPSYLVADADAIDADWLTDKKVIGLTAGASAPEELVQSVIDRLKIYCPEVVVETLDGIQENIQFRLPPALNRLGRDPAKAAKEA